jgi:UDP-2,3-diacylglucosamine hydrolase
VDTLFISDVHLAEERPEKIQLLRDFLQGPARGASALYILGDLFEYFWLGNDDKTPPAGQIIDELLSLSTSGTPLYFLRGNRELVLDKGFEVITGCTLLEDYHIMELAGEKTLLMHGDRLCTRDVNYQIYRRVMQFPLISQLFLIFPYGLRLFLARGLQPWMGKLSKSKPAEIVDVDQETVETTMKKFGVYDLIHGHTHRPGMHEFVIDGKSARRTVLNDWYEEDSVLVVNETGKTLLRVQDYIDSMADLGQPATEG